MDKIVCVVDHVRRMGGPSAVARKLSVSRQAVYNWIENNQVGGATAWKFARLVGMKPEDLRPDMFGQNTGAGEPAPAVQQLPRGGKKAAAAQG